MILFTSEQIQEKVKELAHRISFKHTVDDDVVMICVLNGGFMFFSDLVKEMSIDFEVDFIRAKSYNGQDQGVVRISKDIETNIEEKYVYVVDDFYDTGNTLERILEHLSSLNPRSLQMITLLTEILPLYQNTLIFQVL
jgi:hypoxanthine phosphoribosyltransferase